MTKSVKMLLRLKEKKGIDYRTLAEKTKKSHAYWWMLLARDQRTPSVQNAIEFADAIGLNDEERKTVLNLVFKEKCLEHLEKQGFTKFAPTEEIRNLIKSIRAWTPEKGSPLRYIMSTFFDGGGPDFASEISKLGGELVGDFPRLLNERGRDVNFRGGLDLGSAGFSSEYA